MRIVVDVSTALRWIGHNAVGIVRTEREIARYLLMNHQPIVLIYFDRENQDFRRASASQILDLFPDLRNHPKSINDFGIEFNTRFVFADNDLLISAGLQWDIDFLNIVFLRKKKYNIQVLQIIYDIIPIIMPEYCVPGMEISFPKFIIDTAWTADFVYAISECTKSDFETFSQRLQVPRAPPVRRITLGCDIPDGKELKGNQFGLDKNKFVLFVSTIEPRKNHKMLFDIWRQLSELPDLIIPELVFVGNSGWNTENLISSISNCTRLYPQKIRILNKVSDQELDWLYVNAMFTVYPSLYEGWGLPIAESLARGTPCICSNSSSMPEVAGSFCDMIDPYDYMKWKDLISRYILDTDLLNAKRRHLKENYKVYTWSSAIADFKSDLDYLFNNRMK